MKKFLSLLLALTMLVGMFSSFAVFANELGTIEFFNAADNTAAAQLDGVDSLYANVTFIAKETGTASVMAAHYDIETGTLSAMEFINSVETTEGAVVSYTTPVISVADTDMLKVFAWSGTDTLIPLTVPGTIERVLLEELPTATVTELDVTAIEDVDLTFALNFSADSVTEEQLAFYGNWYADYELIINKTTDFNADGSADAYLSGQYDAWSKNWVSVPTETVTLEANTPVRVMETAAALMGQSGLKLTYADVYTSVKDFDCGIFLSPEFLAANDGVEVKLALKMYNPENEAESYVIGEEYIFNWTLPTATVTELDVTELPVDLDFALNFKADDVTEAQIATFADWYADYELTVNKTVTFNADGTADGYLSGQYDAWSENWVSVPLEDATLEANTPVRVMETAAALMGQSGLKLTCYDVFTSVKDFNCGLAFTPEFLVANPDLEVKLSLKIYNPQNEEEFYIIGKEYTFTPENIPSIDKFIAKEGVTYTHTLDTVEAGTVTFGFDELFTVIGGVPVDMENLTVTGATYADGKLTVEGFGEKTITVTDNYFCNEATATVTVNEPANVDKFVGKDIEVTHTLDTIESNVYTVDFADLFDTNAYAVKDIVVTGGTYADGKVTVTGLGTITVTATDNFYCNTATATVTVNAPANADKFTGNTVTLTHTLDTIENGVVTASLDELFTNNGYNVKEVTVGGDGAYADGVVSFAGTGTFTVTITDNFYCNIATATVIVNAPDAVDKWNGKAVTLTHTLDTIENGVVTASLADLFEAIGPVIHSQDVTVTVDGATVNKVASDWTQTTVDFTAPGEYTLAITDHFYCNTATATVTVNAPANVDKFTGNTVSKKLTYGITTVTATLDELFTNNGYTTKTVVVGGDGTYKDGAVTFTGAGTYTVTITDNFYCNIATATVIVADADPITKFTATNPTFTHSLESMDKASYSTTLGAIFGMDATNGKYITGTVTYTIGNTTGTVDAKEWNTKAVTIPGGATTVNVSIKDGTYCITTSGTVTLKAPSDVTKWNSTNKTINLTLDTYNTNQTVNFADLFTAKSGAYIKTVAVSVNNGGSGNTSTITVPGKAGTYTVTVTDNFYCTASTATITVNNPSTVTKWSAKSGLTYEVDAGASKTLTLADIFTLNNSYKVGNVTYKVDGTSYSATSANWASKSISLAAGTHTITITDDLFSNGTYEATVSVTEKVVEPVQKFTVKDSYYVKQHTVENPGSSDTVSVELGDIFAASGEGTINSANVAVTFSDYVRTIEATYNKNSSDWTQSTITLKYCGEVTVTITDGTGCVAAEAIVATTPLWVGDVDDQDQYNSSEKQKNTINNGSYLTVSTSKTFTVTVPYEGVYGIQWYNVGSTTGNATFTANGYSVSSTVPGGNTWSDDTGVKTDFALYLVQGTNTITVQNNGSGSFTMHSQFNTMRLNKSGYNEYDFMPLVKDETVSAGGSGGDVGGGDTPEQEWPVPEIEWNGKFSNHSMYNGYSVSASPAVSGTYAPGKVTQHTISSPNSPYGAGVYVLQLKIDASSTFPAKIRATTGGGSWAEFELTEDGWSSSCAQDQLIYLEDGNNTLYIENIGDYSFTLTNIDLGYFSAANALYYMYNINFDGAIPTPN